MVKKSAASDYLPMPAVEILPGTLPIALRRPFPTVLPDKLGTACGHASALHTTPVLNPFRTLVGRTGLCNWLDGAGLGTLWAP